MGELILRGEHLSVRRERGFFLAPCDVSIHAGELVGVYGPNGAGKSTLLQALAALVPLESGRLLFKGRLIGRDLSLLAYHRLTAAVFQEPLLLKGTVLDNVALGLRLRGKKGRHEAELVQDWLKRLQIQRLAQRSISSLSAGEAHRTSLARALVLDPDVLFLDEPFTALDAPTRARLVRELGAILAERRTATLFVTHSLAEAAELCHRCLVLDQGHILQHGEAVEIIRRPRNRRVAEIIGAENIFEATVTSVGSNGTWLDWEGVPLLSACTGVAVGRRVTCVLRREHAIAGSPGDEGPNILAGHLPHGGPRHADWRLIELPNRRSLVMSRTNLPEATDQSVRLQFSPEALWITPE